MPDSFDWRLDRWTIVASSSGLDQQGPRWPEGTREFRRRLRLTRWRLGEMSKLLDRWDEYEAQIRLPPSTDRPEVARPELARETARELRAMLTGHVGELLAMWERRN